MFITPTVQTLRTLFEPLISFSTYKMGQRVAAAWFSGRWCSQLTLIASKLQGAFCELTMLLCMEIICNNCMGLLNTLTLSYFFF